MLLLRFEAIFLWFACGFIQNLAFQCKPVDHIKSVDAEKLNGFWYLFATSYPLRDIDCYQVVNFTRTGDKLKMSVRANIRGDNYLYTDNLEWDLIDGEGYSKRPLWSIVETDYESIYFEYTCYKSFKVEATLLFTRAKFPDDATVQTLKQTVEQKGAGISWDALKILDNSDCEKFWSK